MDDVGVLTAGSWPDSLSSLSMRYNITKGKICSNREAGLIMAEESVLTKTHPLSGGHFADPANYLALAEAVQIARNARATVIPQLATAIADPTWDILLFLFIAHEKGEPATVVKTCDSTHAPRATAIRHIAHCEQQGCITRSADPSDRRRVFLALAPAGVLAMRQYLEHLPLTTRAWTGLSKP